MEMDRVPPPFMPCSEQVDAVSWAKKQLDHLRNFDSLKAPKVHVNPNFRSGKSLVIHINPRIHQNRKIHVNPKMMKEIATKTTDSTQNGNAEKIIDDSRVRAEEKRVFPEPVQRSIHVNPKLMKKLSSIARDDIGAATSKPSESARDNAESPTSGKISGNNISCAKTASRPLTPRLLAISRRKLVRIGSSNKPTSCVRRKSLPVAQTRKSPASLSKFVANKSSKFNSNAYKIDRTVAERRKRKKIPVPDARIRNVNKGLVAIGGVMYQSSRTQLVRSGTGSSAHKKKTSLSNAKGDTFVMAKNGKKLHRLQTSKEGTSLTRFMISRNNVNMNTVVKKVPNSVVHSSNKNVISYKAKQRSMQILRDKLRKNYIPCLIYRRFGFCASHAKGTCSKLHDKKQVAPCRKFLQGKCLLDHCPMSHDIGPEKMPTCKYFLEGCCIRDACPYLHVKVSANTPLCAQFLRGYCADGNKCKQRHVYICPEFEKSGKCAKGKYCPYPHKLKKSSSASASKNSPAIKSARTSSLSNKRIPTHQTSSRVVSSSEDSRKRYYDDASPSAKQLAEMRESILKQMELMKASHGHSSNGDAALATGSSVDLTSDDDEQESDFSKNERPKRPPIGPLPAYIPIN